MVKVLLEDTNAEIEVKKSRFLAMLTTLNQAQDIKKLVQQQRLKHPRARHICYAYILKNGQSGSNDDGEPHGTAGRPLLEILTHSQLVDVCVLVIRYFGGILLGKGGLARAYRDAAKAALEHAQTTYLKEEDSYTYQLNYTQFEKVKKLLEQQGIEWTAEFSNTVEITWSTDKQTAMFLQDTLEQIIK